jgi:hypothetical protein
MIQTLLISSKFFFYNKNRNLTIALSLSFFISLILLQNYHLRNSDNLNTLLNNIFQFSGIFSALLITIVISKIFQIRQEKLNRLKEIINLSNRTTDFRRICQILYDEYDFWNVPMRKKMESEYRHLSYFHLHLESIRTPAQQELIDKFHKERLIGSNFYLGVKSLLSGQKRSFQLELYNDYDHNIVYPFKLIQSWHGADSANVFWYFLEDKWNSYKTAFNFTAFSEYDKKTIVLLAKKINAKKYESSCFSKDLLVNIGNDFQSYIFPRLYALTYYNELGIPKTILLLIRILISTMIFGVFIPLWLSSIIITNLDIKIFISIVSIIILSLSIIYFVFSFKKILENEIKISHENI